MTQQAKTLFNTRQVAAGFSVTDITIYSWRDGTASRDQLPVVIQKVGAAKSPRVFFDAASMEKYAKKHGLTFDAAAAAKVAGPSKMGPKGAEKTAPAKKVSATAKRKKAS
jgi:hypothetical protein